MPSDSLICTETPQSPTIARRNSSQPNFDPRYVFYAERHNGTFVADEKTAFQPKFVCQYLHVFELHEADLQNNKWCSACSQTPKKRRKSSFYVNYNNSRDTVDVNCESGHAYQLNLSELKGFKNCPRCSPAKKGSFGEAERTMETEEEALEKQMKNQEAMFIDAYRRLVEAFPLIRKLNTTALVTLYFENELYNRPMDHQPNCLAVHLILTNRGFLRSIFEKLTEQLRRKFFHKISAGIGPAFNYEAKAVEAYEYLHFLAQ